MSRGNVSSCLWTEFNNALILSLGILAGLTLRKGHIAYHRTVFPELLGRQCFIEGQIIHLATRRSFYFVKLKESWVSWPENVPTGKDVAVLEIRYVCCDAGQSRKLTLENRITEGKMVMLVYCAYFLCEPPEENYKCQDSLTVGSV